MGLEASEAEGTLVTVFISSSGIPVLQMTTVVTTATRRRRRRKRKRKRRRRSESAESAKSDQLKSNFMMSLTGLRLHTVIFTGFQL